MRSKNKGVRGIGKAINKVGEHPVWSSVIAGLITALILGAVAAFSAGLDLWRWVKGVGSALLAFLDGTTEIQNWILLILAISALGLVSALVLALLHWRRRKAWRDYRSEVIGGIRWRWGYTGQHLIGPLPHCVECDYELESTHMYGRGHVFHCVDCDSYIETEPIHHTERIRRAIQRNARAKFNVELR